MKIKRYHTWCLPQADTQAGRPQVLLQHVVHRVDDVSRVAEAIVSWNQLVAKPLEESSWHVLKF